MNKIGCSDYVAIMQHVFELKINHFNNLTKTEMITATNLIILLTPKVVLSNRIAGLF